MAEIRPKRFKTRSGETFFVRHAQGKDAEGVLICARQVIAEDVYSLVSIEEFHVGVEEEIEFLESFRKDSTKLFLVAVSDSGEIIGNLDYAPGHRKRIAHTGEFGMGVLHDYRGQGVGSALLEVLIDWAKASETVEKIQLAVHADNDRAIALYEKMGFEVEGVRKRELKYPNGRYVDSLIMARFVK